MELLFLIVAALAPVAVVLWYIFKKDSEQPEPARWLAKGFGFGVISIFLSLAISYTLGELLQMDLDAEVYPSILDAFADAFLMAAIPEELAKLVMLWLLLRKNSYFDEKFDGIVYAVCIGMGFAGLENVMYLLEGVEDGSWITTGITRALFSIPGHFVFAILMGYYYSIYHFGIDRSLRAKSLILLAPVLAHGIYDGILFSMEVDEGLATIGMIAFLFFFNKLRKKGKERIENLMNR